MKDTQRSFLLHHTSAECLTVPASRQATWPSRAGRQERAVKSGPSLHAKRHARQERAHQQSTSPQATCPGECELRILHTVAGQGASWVRTLTVAASASFGYCIIYTGTDSTAKQNSRLFQPATNKGRSGLHILYVGTGSTAPLGMSPQDGLVTAYKRPFCSASGRLQTRSTAYTGGGPESLSLRPLFDRVQESRNCNIWTREATEVLAVCDLSLTACKRAVPCTTKRRARS